MGENTDKVLYPECGQPVKIPAGKEFDQVHSHKKAEPKIRSHKPKE